MTSSILAFIMSSPNLSLNFAWPSIMCRYSVTVSCFSSIDKAFQVAGHLSSFPRPSSATCGQKCELKLISKSSVMTFKALFLMDKISFEIKENLKKWHFYILEKSWITKKITKNYKGWLHFGGGGGYSGYFCVGVCPGTLIPLPYTWPCPAAFCNPILN